MKIDSIQTRLFVFDDESSSNFNFQLGLQVIQRLMNKADWEPSLLNYKNMMYKRNKIMSMNPADHKPTTTFTEAINVVPLGEATNEFKVALSSNGVHVGWLGINSGEWAILVTDQGLE